MNGPPSPSRRLRIEKICDPFDAAWQAGRRPRIEDSLKSASPDERAAVFHELLAVELHCREPSGEAPAPPEYLRRFPDLADEVHAVFRDRAADPTVPASSPPVPAAPALPSVDGYEILSELGRGGMGVVYEARQISLGRVVALKMVRSGRAAGGEELARFGREAEALARLRHPNIVPIYAVGDDNGQPFFVMEFVAGGSLERRLRDGPLPALEAARLAETLARAVHAAHEQQILHRDLKPANVLLADDGTPKVTDFGLAKRLDEDGGTLSGARLGTPSYMAPEQAAGDNRAVGRPADVYGLGAVLYECVTGRAPFRGASAQETLDLVRTREPASPRLLSPNLPRDLETICLKCLRKEAGARYESALDLAEDLRRFLAGESIRARPVPAWERAWKWVGRNKAKAAALGLAAALVVGAAAAGWLYGAAQARLRDLEGEKRGLEEENASREIRLLETQLARSRERERFAETILTQDVMWQADRFKPAAKGSGRARAVWDVQLKANEAALAEYDALLAERQDNVALAQKALMTRVRCGGLCQKLGRAKVAERYFEEALRRARVLAETFPADPSFRDDLASALTNLGNLRQTSGHKDKAESDYAEARTILRELNRAYPRNPKYRDDLAACLANHAGLEIARDRADEARTLLKDALAVRDPLTRDHPDVPRYQSNLGACYFLLGDLEASKGHDDDALEAFGKAVAVLEPVVRDNPDATDAAFRLALTYYSRAAVLRTQDKNKEALLDLDKAVATLDALLRTDPGHAEGPSLRVHALANRGSISTRSGQYDKALADYDRARQLNDAGAPLLSLIGHAHALVGAGKYQDGVARAEALLARLDAVIARATGDMRLPANAAAVYARAAAKAADDGALPEASRKELVEKYAARALKLLGDVHAKEGFKNAEMRGWLEKDPDLAWLRRRQEFQEFSRKVAAGAGNK